ncbi:MAG: AbrB/MazE/SpoVT family DNA-binding domain-containing protein [Coriobacteriales bacterium]|nr:AbrB/MazE/SpoVT family DNA-binding domain-containing protein [Coriobacteriales bacterium]
MPKKQEEAAAATKAAAPIASAKTAAADTAATADTAAAAAATDTEAPAYEQPRWQIYGTATLSERGQLVIPAEARKEFNLEIGERFVVVGVTEYGAIGLIKTDVFSKLADGFMSQANAFASFAQNAKGAE